MDRVCVESSTQSSVNVSGIMVESNIKGPYDWSWVKCPSQVSMVVGFIITVVPSFEAVVIGHIFGFIITVVPSFEVIVVFKALSSSRDVVA